MSKKIKRKWLVISDVYKEDYNHYEQEVEEFNSRKSTIKWIKEIKSISVYKKTFF